VLIKKKSPNI